jgi:hypothetical protein
VNGTLSSDGVPSILQCNDSNGGGSGSGGSIQLYLTYLKGSGNITAQGGDAGYNCGEGLFFVVTIVRN